MSEHVHPMPGQILAHVKNFDEYAETPGNYSVVESLLDANIITSKQVTLGPDQHRLIIDLDVPAQLIASSTEGHAHLYIDKAMSWDTYKNLLIALKEAGLVEAGYLNASFERGFTAVRLPWIKKPPVPPAPPKIKAPQPTQPSREPW